MQPSRTRSSEYRNFLGIDNVNDKTTLVSRIRGVPFVRLRQAENVDIHDDSHISRRSGYSLQVSGSYTSVWSNDEICLGVYEGNLRRIYPDFSTSLVLRNVGANVAYETVSDGKNKIVYFTDSVIIRKIIKNEVYELTNTGKQFKAVLPAGDIIRYFKGSLYVVRENAVFISDVQNREMYDVRWGFKLFESDLTMFQTVGNGFYVSDKSNVYFMERTGTTDEVLAAPTFTLEKIYDVPAVPNTSYKVFNISTPSEKTHKEAVIWVSGNTVCVGGNSGSFETVKEKVYEVPSGRTGTSVVRKGTGLSQYIAIIK